MSITILQTRDNSHTLYVPELDETYHSRNGAIEEAMYVYIGRGLRERAAALKLVPAQPGPGEQPEISLLEIGFGTGLNAWLTAMECPELNVRCSYHSLEAFPLPASITSQLNYTSNARADHQALFNELHRAEWDQANGLTPLFTLHKHHTTLQLYAPQTQFDVIYFDAFAPEKQPELWTEELFRKLYSCLKPGGMIVTYSCKGIIRRLWQNIGFITERLPGPPFKRHMLRGTKPSL
jgi:tRNA U34 5-methylaminomethyl-2-thiouridine-forming methyltransferase MnmC